MRFSWWVALTAMTLCGPACAATVFCERAQSPSGATVCSNSVLKGLLDQENEVYQRLRQQAPTGAVVQDEGHFILSIERCGGDASCIRDLIDDRTAVLKTEQTANTPEPAAHPTTVNDNATSVDDSTPIEPTPTEATVPTAPLKLQSPAAAVPAQPSSSAPATTQPEQPDQPSSPVPVLVFLAVLVGAPIFLIWRAADRRSHARKIFWDVVRRHRSALGRRYLQLVRKDAYGRADFNPWFKEEAVFLRTVRAEMLTAGIKPVLIDATIRSQQTGLLPFAGSEADERTSGLEFDSKMSPRDFEQFCASILERQGWDASLTKGSGDQGVDILGKRGGKTLVAQCKLYSGPVGNKAVQEAYTAKKHMGADIAAVISNGEYTPSARQLADTTGTLLLHFTQLDQL